MPSDTIRIAISASSRKLPRWRAVPDWAVAGRVLMSGGLQKRGDVVSEIAGSQILMPGRPPPTRTVSGRGVGDGRRT